MKLQMPFLGLSLSQLIAGGAAAVLTGTATGELISVVAVRTILKKEIYRVLQEEN
jgi:energy-converting hydrogenase Eha subunit E